MAAILDFSMFKVVNGVTLHREGCGPDLKIGEQSIFSCEFWTASSKYWPASNVAEQELLGYLQQLSHGSRIQHHEGGV